jgi:hypothetical protein
VQVLVNRTAALIKAATDDERRQELNQSLFETIAG